jgi:hypothetical protein
VFYVFGALVFSIFSPAGVDLLDWKSSGGIYAPHQFMRKAASFFRVSPGGGFKKSFFPYDFS